MKSLLLITIACICFSPAALHAQAIAHANGLTKFPQPSEQRLGRQVELIVDDTGAGLAAGTFELAVDPRGHTMIYFPEDIERANALSSPDFEVRVVDKRAMIYTRKRRLAPDVRRTVTFTTASMATSFVVTPAVEPSDAVYLVTVRKRSEKEALDARLASYLAEGERKREREMEQEAKEGVLDRLLAMSATPVQPKTVLGDVAHRAADTSKVTISNFQAVWSGNDMILKFDVENTGARAFEWAEAQAYGQDPSANHAGAARISRPAEPAEALVGRVPPGQRARAAILVERARDISGPMTILLEEPGKGRSVMAVLHNWVPMQTHHTVQQMELRPVEPPDPERGKVSLHLQGVYGAIWLGDGAGLDQSDATSLTGLGVRAQYAFNRWLAFEGEVTGAGSGSAHFQEVTFEGMQGDLTRSAKLGRAQFGGVLRFGEGPYVPLARLGVGLQGASHSGTLTTATGEAPGPDSFDFDALWYFGAGIDIRLGDHFRAGFTASGAAISGNLQSIEAGLHLGYAWNP